MAEFNATAFLTQLDAFGRPPPPQKLNEGRGNVAKELATKLNMINLDKQRRIRGEMLAPSEQGMVQLGNGLKNAKVVRKQICDADVQKWRNDVLSVNRPRVNGLNQHETAESAREYARKIADTIPKTNGFHALSGSDEDVGNRSDSATNSLPSPSSELIVTTSHERKYSDYSSASSQKSPTPPSQSSFSDYRSQASPPDSQRSDSPLKTDGLATRVNVSSVQADRFSRRSPPEHQLMASPKQRADLSLAEILSRKQQLNGSSPNYAVGLTQQVRLTDKTMPAGKPPVFKPAGDEQKRQVRWREISDALEAQDQKFEKLSEQLRRDLVVEQKHQVVLRVFREQQFYLSDGRFYCKQDYLYNMERKVTRCAECKQPIQEMVLSALGRNYHPACFTCTACGMCLDGIQFALDKNNQVYCLPDYHDRFAPRCHRCKNAILPDESTGETVRIVALDNNYHLDCYSCEVRI
ncbi:unnamed protein product [Haemonchus placei]|uniref:LIM zinc-binding domain-containing protein n=1 Tax=Haemonchus placei TaxID=6290 RepID=A0A0N4X1S6_HAEPC|nr:unnamed protein product [Haemonchus placei]